MATQSCVPASLSLCGTQDTLPILEIVSLWAAFDVALSAQDQKPQLAGGNQIEMDYASVSHQAASLSPLRRPEGQCPPSPLPKRNRLKPFKQLLLHTARKSLHSTLQRPCSSKYVKPTALRLVRFARCQLLLQLNMGVVRQNGVLCNPSTLRG